MDGCQLTVDASEISGVAGICVSGDDNFFTVYGQTNGTGKLIATGGEFSAGIGGGNSQPGQNITINGGTVTATGGNPAAGIGGGTGGAGHDIIINGGIVTVTGGKNYGAGIGGGNAGQGYDIHINGGTVTATGGNHAAGIGSGDEGDTASNITVKSSLVVKADANTNPPTTKITHTTETDIAESLAGKQYVTIVPTYKVTYDDNVSDEEISVPTDSNSPYESGEEVTVLDGSTLTRTGYKFIGWNTNKNATTALYEAGDKFNITSDTTLYAVWQSLGYEQEITITMPELVYGRTKTEISNSLALSDSNLEIVGWELWYNDGESYIKVDKIDKGGAYFICIVIKGKTENYYFVNTHNAGNPIPDYYSKAITVENNDTAMGTLSLGVKSYDLETFGLFDAEDDLSNTASDNVYLGNRLLFRLGNSVIYDDNVENSSVENMPSNESYLKDAPVTVAAAPTRAGYKFLSWNTEEDGTGTSYVAGGSFTMGEDEVTLYAIWKEEIKEITFTSLSYWDETKEALGNETTISDTTMSIKDVQAGMYGIPGGKECMDGLFALVRGNAGEYLTNGVWTVNAPTGYTFEYVYMSEDGAFGNIFEEVKAGDMVFYWKNPHNHNEKIFPIKLDSLFTGAAGNYYLAEDVKISDDITISGDVKICLNGNTLTSKKINIAAGASLSIYDCDGDGKLISSVVGYEFIELSGSAKDSVATFNLYGGNIELPQNVVLAYIKYDNYGNVNLLGGNVKASRIIQSYGITNCVIDGCSFEYLSSTITNAMIEFNSNNSEKSTVSIDNTTITADNTILINAQVVNITIGEDAVLVNNFADRLHSIYLYNNADLYLKGTIRNNVNYDSHGSFYYIASIMLADHGSKGARAHLYSTTKFESAGIKTANIGVLDGSANAIIVEEALTKPTQPIRVTYTEDNDYAVEGVAIKGFKSNNPDADLNDYFVEVIENAYNGYFFLTEEGDEISSTEYAITQDPTDDSKKFIVNNDNAQYQWYKAKAIKNYVVTKNDMSFDDGYGSFDDDTNLINIDGGLGVTLKLNGISSIHAFFSKDYGIVTESSSYIEIVAPSVFSFKVYAQKTGSDKVEVTNLNYNSSRSQTDGDYDADKGWTAVYESSGAFEYYILRVALSGANGDVNYSIELEEDFEFMVLMLDGMLQTELGCCGKAYIVVDYVETFGEVDGQATDTFTGTTAGSFVCNATVGGVTLTSNVINIPLVKITEPTIENDYEFVTNGNDDTTYQWYRANSNGEYVVVEGQNTNTLTKELAGKYKCKATLGDETIESDVVGYIICITADTQEYVCDGTAKAFVIESDDVTTGFTIKYSKDCENWTETAPTEIGTYSVQITRADDNEFPEFDCILMESLVIKANTHEVSFDTNGGSEKADITIDDNGKITEDTAPTKDGYKFDGWFKDEACTILWDFENDVVTSDTVLYAKWTAVEENTKTGLTGGAIAGIVIGIIIFLLLILYIIGAMLYREERLKGKFFDAIYAWVKQDKIEQENK